MSRYPRFQRVGDEQFARRSKWSFRRWLRRRQKTEFVTKSGRVLTEGDIEDLADEAERGYDVTHLKERP